MLKITIILLSTLLAVQLIYARHTVDHISAELGERDKLLFKVEEVFVDLFSYSAENYRELFQKVLKSSKEAAEFDEELKKSLKPFQDFVDRTENLQDLSKEDLHKLFKKSTELANEYEGDEYEGESGASKKIAKYLEDADAIKTKFDTLMKYVASLQKFGNTVRKYLNSLTEAERQDDVRLVNWYEDWRREKDWENKLDILLKFFDVYKTKDEQREQLVLKIIEYALVYLESVVSSRADVYEEVAEEIEKEFDNPNESMKFQLDLFKSYKTRSDKSTKLEGKEVMSELMRLYSAGLEFDEKYGGNSLAEDEYKIAKFIEKHYTSQMKARDILLTFGYGDEVIRVVEDYLNSLKKDEKAKETKLTKWLEDVQEEMDPKTRAEKILSVLGNLVLE